MVSVTVFKLGSAAFLGLLTIAGGPLYHCSSRGVQLTTQFFSPVLTAYVAFHCRVICCAALLPLRLTSVSEQKRVSQTSYCHRTTPSVPCPSARCPSVGHPRVHVLLTSRLHADECVLILLQTKILSHSSFFTGGVFLGAGLLHMLPDASHDLSSHYSFPVVFAMASLGFLLIYSLDKINFSDHQLDNTQLVSMAVGRQGGNTKICYVSVRPVVLSYGSFRNNQQEVVRQVQDAAHKMVTEGEVALPQEADGGQPGGESAFVAMGDHFDDDTQIAVYPAVTVVPMNDDAQPEEEGKVQSQQAEEKEQESVGRQQARTKGKDKRHKVKTAISHSHMPSSKPCSGHHGHTNEHAHSKEGGRVSLKHSTASKLSSDKATPASPLLDKSNDVHQSTTWPYPNKTAEDGGADGDDEGEHEHEELHHHHINIPHHALLPIFLAIVFSIHSLIEGLALGAQQAVSSSAVSILIAISSHKVIEAVSVGANFIKQGVATSTALPVLIVYTLMTPLGIVAGWLLEWSIGSDKEDGDSGLTWGLVIQSLLQAFAAGSFLYLAVHEISDEKCCAAVKRTHQVLLMVVGLGAMALLAVWA